jgi:ESAT-6 family protein
MAPQSAHSQERMQQAAGKVQEAHSEISRIKGQLHGHQGELMSQWKGQSASKFAQIFQLFDTEFGKVLQDLNIIHEKLVDTKVKYNAAEQQKDQRVNQITGLLNA